jgi:hypothetical protein
MDAGTNFPALEASTAQSLPKFLQLRDRTFKLRCLLVQLVDLSLNLLESGKRRILRLDPQVLINRCLDNF